MKILKLLSVHFRYWIIVITTALITIVLGVVIQYFFNGDKESVPATKATSDLSSLSSKKQEKQSVQSHLQTSQVYPETTLPSTSTLQSPRIKQSQSNQNNHFPLNNSVINTSSDLSSKKQEKKSIQSHLQTSQVYPEKVLPSTSTLQAPRIKQSQSNQNNHFPLNNDIVNTPYLLPDRKESAQKTEKYFNPEKGKHTSSNPKSYPISSSSNHSSRKQKLGHFACSENIQKNLVKVGNYYHREIFLDYEAAKAFKLMQLAAKNDGVDLILISGFRSILDQEKLFQKQIQRRGSREEAAKLSAPPGFSEHHTGFAIDIGDGQQPDSDLKFSFEKTSAYSWLLQHAYIYGFELSFPPNNTQGVSFEPWHWRYVISERANQSFYQARKIN